MINPKGLPLGFNLLSYIQFMTETGKQLYTDKKAREAIDNWQGCPLHELEAAAKIFDSAILLLINRYTS